MFKKTLSEKIIYEITNIRATEEEQTMWANVIIWECVIVTHKYSLFLRFFTFILFIVKFPATYLNL